MGVKTMTEKSKDKAKKTTTIDKSTTVQGDHKDAKDELTEEELKRVTGGNKRVEGD
jgi:bacteriocin-like protein